jgi:hypothetical protein
MMSTGTALAEITAESLQKSELSEFNETKTEKLKGLGSQAILHYVEPKSLLPFSHELVIGLFF